MPSPVGRARTPGLSIGGFSKGRNSWMTSAFSALTNRRCSAVGFLEKPTMSMNRIVAADMTSSHFGRLGLGRPNDPVTLIYRGLFRVQAEHIIAAVAERQLLVTLSPFNEPASDRLSIHRAQAGNPTPGRHSARKAGDLLFWRGPCCNCNPLPGAPQCPTDAGPQSLRLPSFANRGELTKRLGTPRFPPNCREQPHRS